jgi:hypothetical protein
MLPALQQSIDASTTSSGMLIVKAITNQTTKKLQRKRS